MRRSEEDRAWDKYDEAMSPAEPLAITVGTGKILEFRRPCTVVAGRNGTGKSRLLRAAAAELGERALLIELHMLTQRVLDATRSRQDLEEMSLEFGAAGPDGARLADLARIVGRDYEAAEWFALEIELAEEYHPESFFWGDEQTLVPYFRSTYRGASYSSAEMGLGEFAAHLLLWILEQYRDTRDLVILLDEPDAFLPPVAAAGLLARLLSICRARGWRMVLTTHSDELIRRAANRGALMILGVDQEGDISAEYSDDDPDIAEHLLTRSPTENVLFVEDESAWHLASAALRAHSRPLWRSTNVVWGAGHGGLRALHVNLPRERKPDLRFAMVFDGDQRGTAPEQAGWHWPIGFLPTDRDPDQLFRSLKDSPTDLATALSTTEVELQRVLATLEGVDDHDWVNDLGEVFGRQVTLAALARLWVSAHSDESNAFVEELLARWAEQPPPA